MLRPARRGGDDRGRGSREEVVRQRRTGKGRLLLCSRCVRHVRVCVCVQDW